MSFPPKIWVFYLLVFSPKFCLAEAPLVIPVRNFPSAFGYVSTVTDTADSIVVGGVGGVAMKNATGWTTLRTPAGGNVPFTLPFRTGFFAAGESFSYIYSNGVWRDLHIDDDLYAGAELNGALLLCGRRGIYHVSDDGAVQDVFKQSGRSIAFIHRLRDRLVLFAGEDGVFVWNEATRKLDSGNDLYPWGMHREILRIQERAEGGYFVFSSKGFFIEDATGEHQIAGDVSPHIIGEGLIGGARFGDILVVATWKSGLFGLSLSTGKTLWTIPPEVFSGNINSLNLRENGLAIGTTNGLWILPDLERSTFALLPKGNIYFAHRFSGQTYIGLSSGETVDEKGVSRHLGEVFSMAEMPDGELLLGRWGRIEINHVEIPLGGQEVDAVAAIDQSHGVTLQPGVVSLIDLTTKGVVKLSVPRTPNSLATEKDGKIYIGTSDGVYSFSRDGKSVGRFGQGVVRVRSFKAGVVALDAQGNLFREDGALETNLPVSELVDVEEWAGEMCLLARTSDGIAWVGLVKKKSWVPLDIPTPVGPEELAVEGNQLLVVGAGMLVRTANPRLLGPPQSDAFLLKPKGETISGKSVGLAANEDSVDLIVGPGRLDPWRSPAVSFRAGAGAWVSVPNGTRIAIPRLTWGATPIRVRSQWAGLEAETEFTAFRATPWWASYPAIFGYLLAFGSLGYGIVRWRTWRLERRAAQLEDVVAQRTAQLRQAQQAREDFFSMMSHEIRNPLNGVVGLCEIVENAPAEAVAPRERMLLKTLRGCADQLRSILDDILDFSRIDRGEVQLHEETFELIQAVEGAARGVDASLKRCILELPDNPLWVRGDCGKIRQIVTNLVSNALKYGLPPTARILVQIENRTELEAQVCIRVLNTGNTIPAEELRQIFEGYVRGEDARRRRIAGTGLGLAVSRRIASAMRGSLDATSINGLTEFRLSLQLTLTVEPPEVMPELSRPKNSRALGIEDEPYNRLVLGSILGQLGYEVDWAADGAEALAHVRTGSYDLILTDFMLPDTTGTELARRIIEMLPEPRAPIIAVTAYSTPEKMQQAKDAGIAAFVTKPVSKKKIEQAIMGAVGGFTVGRALEVPSLECDFSQILRLKEGPQMLAEYADDLPLVWAKIIAAFDQGVAADERARLVHAFRSRVLAVHATVIAEQLALLEDAATRNDRNDASRLIPVLEPLLKELEELARARALTHQH